MAVSSPRPGPRRAAGCRKRSWDTAEHFGSLPPHMRADQRHAPSPAVSEVPPTPHPCDAAASLGPSSDWSPAL